MPALSAILHRQQRGHRLCTGAKSLDRDLARIHGSDSEYGIPSLGLTELAGPPASGKTEIALMLAIDALCSGQSVLWLGCDSRIFPRQRFDELARGRLYDTVYPDAAYLDTLAQLFTLKQREYRVIIIEHYDLLVDAFNESQGDRRENQTKCLLRYLFRLASQAAVLITCTLVPRRVDLDDSFLTLAHGIRFPLIKGERAARLSLYRDEQGAVVSAMGTRLTFERQGIADDESHEVELEWGNSSVLSMSSSFMLSEPRSLDSDDSKSHISLLSSPARKRHHPASEPDINSGDITAVSFSEPACTTLPSDPDVLRAHPLEREFSKSQGEFTLIDLEVPASQIEVGDPQFALEYCRPDPA